MDTTLTRLIVWQSNWKRMVFLWQLPQSCYCPHIIIRGCGQTGTEGVSKIQSVAARENQDSTTNSQCTWWYTVIGSLKWLSGSHWCDPIGFTDVNQLGWLSQAAQSCPVIDIWPEGFTLWYNRMYKSWRPFAREWKASSLLNRRAAR